MQESNTTQNHYTLLRVKPTASPQEIRRAYRDLSKLYHPDTTTLPPETATEKFKILNAAYATLSNPEARIAYDYSIGISRVAVIQAPSYLNRPASERGKYKNKNAYLDPTDRPLSPGELFALFILGVTFVGCLILVFAIGWTKGEIVLSPSSTEAAILEQTTPLQTERTSVSDLPSPQNDQGLPSPDQETGPIGAPPLPDTPPKTQEDVPKPLPFENLSPKII
ncbi:J domain-containing protein [Oscillatoria sp. CS-180]|uniref:J domain-containing protein n=1 Tax=Oscillatoria sp. CS-180 TaxID=3021720 RepID=UPI00232CF433|nr:J domain-containing protein [Oscillatoria sp. CS-180]MDB9529017.1 J domain-containing protein [Oscillatoria sp. CS-180]